jgi:hypothetical protein
MKPMRHALLVTAFAALTMTSCSPAPGADAGTSGGGGGTTGGGVTGGGATGGGGGTGGGVTGGGVTGGGATGGGPPGTGDAGTPCRTAGDCASGVCLDWFRDAGALCAATCFDRAGCAGVGPDFVCSLARDGGGLCAPRSPAHCLPCNFDSDCGALSEACVLGPGETQMTCRVDCSVAGADACPPEYACTQVNFGGQPRSFCLPPMPCPTAKAGFCDRYAVPQTCQAANDAGVCDGQRPCVGDRFEPCDAQQPQCKATCTTPDRPGCTEPLCEGATQVPEHCGACNAPCPGAGFATTEVACGDGGCTFACRGENYDVDGAPDSGCEVRDSPTGNHTIATAASQGSLPCNDSSTLNASGAIPSDLRSHLNPAVTGFDVTKGAAPDYLSVNATGGTFCVNDIGITLTVTGVTPLNCFRLTINTDRGQYTCSTGASGTCTITSGSGSYGGGSTITLVPERTCAAARGNARYTVAGHF